MSTHHIRATRKAWHEHLTNCSYCGLAAYPGHALCEPTGRLLYGEYAASITANPLCEHVTGTEVSNAYMTEDIKIFTFFWLDGKRDVLQGRNTADALNRAGYGQGAVAALDFWTNGDDHDYQWNEANRKWIKEPQGCESPIQTK